MNKKANFKNISSILLLFVFTLGITPKKTLHDWFANHKDSASKIPDGKTPQVSNAGFNCICDDLVAESNFISAGSFAVVNIPAICSLVPFHDIEFISLPHFHFNLRGPPLKF